MSTGLIIAIIVGAVVVIAVVTAIALAIRAKQRRARLRDKFGDEYDHAVHGQSGRRAGERELEHREKRHAQLDIRPLSPAAHERYTRSWGAIQQQFVDRPASAVVEADRVLTELMSERGYPTQGFEQQLADLSVEHSRTLEHYRTAHDTMLRQQENKGTTEDLRSAMLHYRTLFEELLDTGDQSPPAQQPGHRGDPTPPTGPVPQQQPPGYQGAAGQAPAQQQYPQQQYQQRNPQQPVQGGPQHDDPQRRQPAGQEWQPVQPDQPMPRGGPQQPAGPGQPAQPGQQFPPGGQYPPPQQEIPPNASPPRHSR
ncbi:hypothetical protein [Amycolatopsis antarctica]|uniref:hypothetical protein n=1 Tax=Amycolatopsis antarctica TaxID=1854586 RepID=UPI00196ABA99|nr:hypothetical protein [Amycolatopsis antarctica]